MELKLRPNRKSVVRRIPSGFSRWSFNFDLTAGALLEEDTLGY
jgi:hypothetical protein